MSLLSKRESLTQNITYMSIMAAINAIFSLIATFFPLISLVVMIILPLTSAIVFLFCRHRYFIIYAIATIALCLLITIYDMSFTIFYVAPSIITGYLFGILIKHRLHAVWLILLTSIAQAAFSALAIPVINAVFGVDIIGTFKSLLQLQNSVYIDAIIPSFLFFLSLVQMVFSYIVISSEISKFGYEVDDGPIDLLVLPLVILGAIIAIIPLSFFLVGASYLMLSLALYSMVFVIFRFIAGKRRNMLIIIGISAVVSIFAFAFLFSLLPSPYALLLSGILPFVVGVIAICDNVLLMRASKDKMKGTGER